MIGKGRLEAFTDAIIAIAATIMVLEMTAPDEVTISALSSQWTIFLAYINSFFMIYIVWINHYKAFRKIEEVSIPVFFINGLWLFVLTLVPFTTSWVGKHPNDTLPELLYAGVLLIWSLLYGLMDRQIVKENPDLSIEIRNSRSLTIPMYAGFVLAMILAFIKPILCLITILWVMIIVSVHFLVVRGKKKNR